MATSRDDRDEASRDGDRSTSLDRHAAEPRDRPSTGSACARLVLIRWVAIAGQAVTLLIVHFGLGFRLPLLPALAVVAPRCCSISCSIALRRAATRLGEREAALYLGYDIAAARRPALSDRRAAEPVRDPDPGAGDGGGDDPVAAPGDRAVGVRGRRDHACSRCGTCRCPGAASRWSSRPLSCSASGWRWCSRRCSSPATPGASPQEARRLRDAVAATQLALAREQRVSAVGALAAAAAHELGSPLATIAVVAKELVRDLPADRPHAEDAALLLSQTERCRQILAELAHQPERGRRLALYAPADLGAGRGRRRALSRRRASG